MNKNPFYLPDQYEASIYAGGWHCCFKELADTPAGAAADPTHLVAATVTAYQALPQFERIEVTTNPWEYRIGNLTGRQRACHIYGPGDRLRVVRGRRKSDIGERRLVYKIGGREFDPTETEIRVFFSCSISDIAGTKRGRHA